MPKNDTGFNASKNTKKKPKKKFGSNPNFKSDNQAPTQFKKKNKHQDDDQSRSRSDNRSQKRADTRTSSNPNAKNKAKKHSSSEWAKKSQNKPQNKSQDKSSNRIQETAQDGSRDNASGNAERKKPKFKSEKLGLDKLGSGKARSGKPRSDKRRSARRDDDSQQQFGKQSSSGKLARYGARPQRAQKPKRDEYEDHVKREAMAIVEAATTDRTNVANVADVVEATTQTNEQQNEPSSESSSEQSSKGKPVFNVSAPVQMALDEMGFKHPSPIQAQAIPVLVKGKDLIGQAQTGTGKTAAFAIPILEQIEATKREQINTVQALVLCPTRELCLQLAGEFRKLGQFMPDVDVVSVYGGKPIDRQIKMLKKKPQIVIGTPGRTLDLIRRGNLKLHAVNTAVLDEADEMLNMGFRPDIEAILRATPKSRQTVFFSATMPQAIVELAEKFQHNAQLIKVAKHDQPLVKIEQSYFEVPKSRKMMALEKLLKHHRFGLAVVFCNTKWKVDSLVKKLKTQGYKADGLHGGKTQSQRDRIMQGFRKGKCTLLVATDVAARGLDVDNVEAVINYDMPNDNEFYVHRIGRTGRAGKSGQAFTFVDEDERRQLRDLCKFANVQMQRKELPA